MLPLRALVSVCAAALISACATHIPASEPLPMGQRTLPPAGYQAYCEHAAHDSACGFAWADGLNAPALSATTAAAAYDARDGASTRAEAGQPLTRPQASKPNGTPTAGPQTRAAMDSKLWRLLTRVNKRVNARLLYATDLETHNRRDVWSTPLSDAALWRAAGDCEDYALEKRIALREAGLPDEAMSIAVALLPDLTWHAVLLVSTDHGDYVLDNRFSDVTPWRQTPYYWVARERAGRIDDWRSIKTASVDG